MSLDRNSIWLTRDGKQIPIKDMTDSHIQACLNIMKGTRWREEYGPVLKEELELREKIRNSPLGKALE